MSTAPALTDPTDRGYYADIADAPPPPEVKLGRKQPKVRPLLQAERFFAASTTVLPNRHLAIPPAVHRSDRARARSMFANGPDPSVTLNAIVAKYGVGSCFPAAILHRIQHAYVSTNRVPPPFTGDDSLRLYQAIEGYDWTQTAEDGSNPTDTGCEPNKGFAHWVDVGVPLPPSRGDWLCPASAVDRAVGFMQVPVHNATLQERSVYEFDGMFRGYAMPASAQGQAIWTVTDPSLRGEAEPGSWGGHETYEVSYDPIRTAIETWGAVYLADRRYNRAYSDQCTVVLNEDILSRSGISPLGFNYDLLHADLGLL